MLLHVSLFADFFLSFHPHQASQLEEDAEAPASNPGGDDASGGGASSETHPSSSDAVASPTKQSSQSMGFASRRALRELQLVAEAGEEGVAGGTQKRTSTLDVARNVLSGFGPSASAGEGADAAKGGAGGQGGAVQVHPPA
jgi:hypothetical protein